MHAAATLALHQSLIIQVGVKSERKGYSFQPALLSPPQRASQSAFLLTSLHRDLASQSQTPPPTFYHSPLLASCPGDVTRHMVFSSIKPEKRFSQRREKVSEGVGLERRAGQRRKTKAQLFLLRVEGGEDSGKGGGRLHCVRRMRRERAAASAMCCTDADWAGPRTKTFAQSLKRS